MTDELSGKRQVPVDELRKLIKKWNEITDPMPIDQHEAGYHSATDARAEELQEVIDRYE